MAWWNDTCMSNKGSSSLIWLTFVIARNCTLVICRSIVVAVAVSDNSIHRCLFDLYFNLIQVLKIFDTNYCQSIFYWLLIIYRCVLYVFSYRLNIVDIWAVYIMLCILLLKLSIFILYCKVSGLVWYFWLYSIDVLWLVARCIALCAQKLVYALPKLVNKIACNVIEDNIHSSANWWWTVGLIGLLGWWQRDMFEV